MLGLLSPTCEAASLRFCDPQVKLTIEQQDRLFRFGARIKEELEASDQRVALIARSGLDLSRFGDIRYSHAGVSLRASRNTAWSVRQLYYACDERKPRLFDQGMSGFVLGTDDPSIGFVSLVFLPAGPADMLERVTLDDRLALSLLSGVYSANAYPFSDRYQNCNQWVMELLATAWGQLDLVPEPTAAPGTLRERAQRWLKNDAYRPMVFDVNNVPLMWAGGFVPWLHYDDHPPEDLATMSLRVSMPASIDAFVRAAVPQATRVEFCHTDRHMVIHRGWTAIADGCVPAGDDTIIRFD